MSEDVSLLTEEEIADEIKELVDNWKDAEGNLIMIFHGIQKHYGYVPRNIAKYVSEKINIPLARIYEILTFYNYFTLEPPAENNISICMGTACYLKGGGQLVEEVKRKLNLKGDQKYSADRKYKLEEVRCIGCCGLAPVMTFNGEVSGRVVVDDIAKFLNNNNEDKKE